MDEQQVEMIKKQIEYLETDNLLDIWRDHDDAQWTEEAFEAVRQLLLSRVVELPTPDDQVTAKVHLQQAEEYLDADEPYKALSECNLALKLAPHYGYGYSLKGTILDEMGKLEEAVKFYQEALRLNPNLEEAKQYLSWALEELGEKSYTPEERILAALAHGSILLSYYGLLIPAIIWITQRERSRFVGFQSLQAIVFQLLAVGFQFISTVLTLFKNVIPSLANVPSNTFMPWVTYLHMAVSLIQIMFVIYGFSGVIATLSGVSFRYLWVGTSIERYFSRSMKTK